MARSHAPSNSRRDIPQRSKFGRKARVAAVAGIGAMAITVMSALPALASSVHVVKPGDTLSKIAKEAGLSSWRPVFDANGVVKNPDLIFPGQRLVVPDSNDNVQARALPQAKSAAKPKAKAKASVQHATKSTTSKKSTTTSKKSGGTTRSSTRRASSSGDNVNGGVWDRIAACESGGNWHINTGNGYYGGLQFSLQSWRAVGGTGYPHQASKSTQIAMAQRLQRIQGWGAWPVCSSRR